MVSEDEMTGGWWWQVADGEEVAALAAWRFKSPNTREGQGDGGEEGVTTSPAPSLPFSSFPFYYYFSFFLMPRVSLKFLNTFSLWMKSHFCFGGAMLNDLREQNKVLQALGHSHGR